MALAGSRLAILDRDGTLIDVVRDEETGAITTAFHPNQLRLLEGVVPGLATLRDAGFVFALATNQPGPAKGHFSAQAVARTNDALVALLAEHDIVVRYVAVCMHHPKGGAGGDPALVGPCSCRKPEPGMLLDAIRELDIAPNATWMIGDSSADVQAAKAARIRCGLLFADNRCELCPLRHGPQELPACHAPQLDLLARLILQFEYTAAAPRRPEA